MSLTPNQRRAVNQQPNRQTRQRMINNFLTQGNQSRPIQAINSNAGTRRFNGRNNGNLQQYRQPNQVTQVRRNNNSSATNNTSMQVQGNATVTLTRSGFFSTFVSGGSGSTSITQVIVRPTEIPWIRSMSVPYGRYKMRSVKYRFVTAASSTVSGSIATAIDANPESGIRPKHWSDMMMLQSPFIGPVNANQPGWTFFPRHLTDRWFRIDPSGDQTTFPGAIICAVNHPNADSGVVLGHLELNITISFNDPEFNSFSAQIPNINLDETDAPFPDGYTRALVAKYEKGKQNEDSEAQNKS